MKFNLKCILAYAAVLSMAFSMTSIADTGTVTAAATETAGAENNPTETVWLSATISGSNVSVTGTMSGTPSGEDGQLYLFELAPYEDSISGKTPLGSVSENGSIGFNYSLGEGTSSTKLYSKFVAAVKKNGQYTAVSSPAYITNPEVIAKSKLEYKDPLTKKGLLIELPMIDDAFQLGVKHVIVNINFAQFIGSGISYNYEGKTYQFAKSVVESYDKTISTMSNKSMLVTCVILNGWNDSTPELFYPGVTQQSTAFYYGFNTATKEGFETTRALASFLADRYSGENSNYGRVSNWVVGNEINNNGIWNYMGPIGFEKYMNEYERSFRVFYTAIKSTSANAKLFFSVDEYWNNPSASDVYYSAKNVIDTLNNDIRNTGNINWEIAYHPYPIPMTNPNFWDDDQTGLIKQDESTTVIDFANLHVLTDYLEGSNFRDPSGNVRHIILSEQGFTSTNEAGENVENLQAAAFAYAYYIADSNPYVDAFILSRQVDNPLEADTGCNFGLWTVDMSSRDSIKAVKTKKIWDVFKNIDKKNNSLNSSEFAKSIIGINKWSDVISNFRYRNQE